jgi:hypothetical protein
MHDVTCTWRHCPHTAVESITDARGRTWAQLCRQHAHELEQAARIDHPQWSAWRLFRLSIEARGGWWAAVRGWVR